MNSETLEPTTCSERSAQSPAYMGHVDIVVCMKTTVEIATPLATRRGRRKSTSTDAALRLQEGPSAELPLSHGHSVA